MMNAERIKERAAELTERIMRRLAETGKPFREFVAKHLQEIAAESAAAARADNKRLIAVLREACEAAYHRLTDIHDGNYGEHPINPVPSLLRKAIAEAKS